MYCVLLLGSIVCMLLNFIFCDGHLYLMCMYLQLYIFFISGISQTKSFKSASHLLNYAADISRLPQVTSSDFGVSKSSSKGAESCAVTGMSQLQLQLDFVSHLMRIGERLSQLPTKELRGMSDCQIANFFIMASADAGVYDQLLTFFAN